MTKRQKSEDVAELTTIEDKVKSDSYDSLDRLVADITQVVKIQVSALESSNSGEDQQMAKEAITNATRFKDRAHELYRRELAYPNLDPFQPQKAGTNDVSEGEGRVSLLIYSSANAGRKPLLTGPQKRPEPCARGVEPTPITGANLPRGVFLAKTSQASAAAEKPNRSLTLGELFPSPRNLPPLQPYKPAKNTIKNNVLTFYHPELTNQSKFRTGTYFSQNLSTGRWLDYSNATPTSHIKTKQRQRAQSLAGHKPSSTELEMSEMEALFRGAFSSFAPCKDDTAAMVSAGQLSHMYWQQWGRRNLRRMIETEAPGDGEADAAAHYTPVEVDEDLIREALDTWDDSVVDPTLSQAMGEKSTEAKEVDDLLEEVSDLIETLASYQRNRNLTLPTSQDRHSADPPNGDMLRNASLAHQPSEEEMLTYQALKSQLSLIIRGLPPFAVARINSDKLEELNVSTKIQVRTTEYVGVMEEDEPAARARQQAVAAQAAANSGQRTSHRTPSVSAAVPYSTQQYNAQYGAASRSPMPNTPHHYPPQTPGRAPPSSVYRRGSSSAVPIQQPHQNQGRPAQQQQPYRTPSGYGGLAPQLAKSQTPYGHSTMPQYTATTTGQPRIPPHPSYHSMVQGTPGAHRYAPGYPGGFPQQQQQQQQHHVQQRQYPPYMNGATQLPQRTISPQIPGQSPHAYSQPATPSQQHPHLNRAAYATPGQAGPPATHHYSSVGQGTPHQAQQHPGNRAVGITGYHTVMGDAQQHQVLEQARQQAQARHDAHSRTISYGSKASQGEISGLAGIGLTGNVDFQKLAAARANMAGVGAQSMSPSPKPPVQPARSPMPAGANGTVGLPPPSASPIPAPGNSVSPSPTGGFNPPS